MKANIDFKRYIWGEIAAAAISGTAAVLGNRMRNEAQARENEKAFERERQQVAEMNAYNSASSQAARLQAAGLNPNLMYGQSPAQAAGQQQDIAHYQPADVTNAFGSVGESVGSVAQSLIGIREQENKNQLAEAELLTQAQSRDLMQSEVHLNDAQATKVLELLGYDKELMAAEAENFRVNSTKVIKEYDEIDARIENYRADTNKLIKDLEVADESIELMKHQISKLDAEQLEILALLPSRKALLQANTQERWSMVFNAVYQREVWAAEANLKAAQAANDTAEISKWQKELELMESANAREWVSTISGALVDGMSIATFIMNPTGSIAGSFGRSTLSGAGHYGAGTATRGMPFNSPSKVKPSPARRVPSPKKFKTGGSR